MKKRRTFLTALMLALPALAMGKEEKAQPYPLKTCIVSDEKLGEMGKPKYLQYRGQIYGFCCKPCTKDFREDPEKFRKKLSKLNKKP
ncbi:MAG: YHS domain-containing protein [Verrucomicrobiales bacterium]